MTVADDDCVNGYCAGPPTDDRMLIVHVCCIVEGLCECVLGVGCMLSPPWTSAWSCIRFLVQRVGEWRHGIDAYDSDEDLESTDG